MRLDEIRIGETYRIRSWDDLASEYGTDDFGTTSALYVKTTVPFSSDHRDICGELFTIKDVKHAYRESEPHYFDPLLSEEGVEVLEESPDGKLRVLVVTAEMLEPFDAYKELIRDSDTESLMNYLFG